MKIIDNKNLFYKIFSVVLAVMLWLYVSNQENPLTEQMFTVPLEIRDLSPTLVITEQPSFVKVRIEGQRQELANVTTRDIHAFLEMDGTDAGMHLLDVNVSVPAKTRLVSVTPTDINVNVETVATAQVPVVVSYANEEPAKGYMALPVVLNPTRVEISGPQDKLKNIKQVFVEVNLAGISANYHQKLPTKVADEDGNLLADLITVSPKEVDVLVPIIRELPSKTVPVKVPLTGSPASGYQVERVVIEPQVVPIYGDFARIDLIDSLSTAAVDIAGATGDVNQRVALQVPGGLTVVENLEITAVVRISKIVEKTFSAVPITQRGLSAGMTATLAGSSVEIVVAGSEALLSKMTLADIQCTIDLTGLPIGSYQLTIQTAAPVGVTVKSVGPSQIGVTLK